MAQPMQLSDDEYFYKLENMVQVSCEEIRKTFRARWKKLSGKDWEESEQQGKKFIRGLGSDAYEKAEPIQKTKIAKGCLDDWDICLLSLAIQNLGEWSSYKVENGAVRRLKDLRNGLAHHLKRKLTLQDYRGKVAVFRKSLKELGVKDEEIEHIITNAGVSCSEAAFKMAKKCYDKAKRRMAKNNFNTALNHCNEAIALPSLLPIHLAVTYENRAECYLRFGEYKRGNQERREGNGYLDEAIRDAKKALEFNKSSWKAHFIIGRCHRLHNELKIAVKHLTSALAISPVQKLVQTELDSCKFDKELQSSPDHLNPNLLPSTLKERVSCCEAETGRKITQKQYLRTRKKMQKMEEILHPGQGQDVVMQGNQYRSGLGVTPNDEEAVRYYAKAAEVGNPEGICNLACAYMDGIGVKRDPSKGLELYLKAAKMSPETPGNKTDMYKNQGVAGAQFKLGALYDTGIVVTQDYSEAAKWYRKAADNGDSFAACNLANLYELGRGVAKNEKMAETYWHLALTFGDVQAAHSLMYHYFNHLEPEKAEAMFKMSRDLDPLELDKTTKDNKFRATYEEVLKERTEKLSEVLEFEKEKNLDTTGLTFKERLKRKLHSDVKEPMLTKLKRIVNNACKGKELTAPTPTPKEKVIPKDINVKLIGLKAKEGSVTAVRILKTRNISNNLIRFVDCQEKFSEKQKTKILNMLYDCVTLEYNIVHFKKETKAKLKRVIDELFNKKRGQQDDEEMKIRLVYVKLNYKVSSNDGTLAIDLLEEGIRLYPNNEHYHELICVHGRDLESLLSYSKKGVEIFPDNLYLLYYKAFYLQYSLFAMCRETCRRCRHNLNVLLPSAPKKMKAAIEAFQQFLNKSPMDDESRPDAFYNIAMMYIVINSDVTQMEHYYNLGKEAENHLLPCHTSAYNSGNNITKTFLETVLSESKLAKEGHLDEGCCEEAAVVAGILERKMHLDSPVRRWVITNHRRMISDLSKKKRLFCSGVEVTLLHGIHILKPKLIQKAPERMSQVKPITLREVNPNSNNIYEDRVMDLTIIDVPLVKCFCSAIHLIAEDEYGDVSQLNIYNMKMNKEDIEKLVMGVKIGILNPYMVSEYGIRNDDPDCIIYLGKVESMCNFCAEPVEKKNVQKCGACKKAVYCSKECQEHDWKIMKHKLVCSSN